MSILLTVSARKAKGMLLPLQWSVLCMDTLACG